MAMSRRTSPSADWVPGRYEHYNTFGGSFVYKFNGISKMSPQIWFAARPAPAFMRLRPVCCMMRS